MQAEFPLTSITFLCYLGHSLGINTDFWRQGLASVGIFVCWRDPFDK